MPNCSDPKEKARCRRCQRVLTNPSSIAKGYGPICIAKEAGNGMQAEEPAEAAS